MRSKIWLPLMLILTLLMPLISSIIDISTVHADQLIFGNASVLPYKDPDGQPTKRYAVGFMSYDIWSNSAGDWQPNKAPNDVIGKIN